MQTVTAIGIDIAKSVFQVHGIDAEGQVIIRPQLRRRYVLAWPVWAQTCNELGFTVSVISCPMPWQL